MHILNIYKSRGSVKTCWGNFLYTQSKMGVNCIMLFEDTAKMEVWVKYMSGPEDTAEVRGRTSLVIGEIEP